MAQSINDPVVKLVSCRNPSEAASGSHVFRKSQTTAQCVTNGRSDKEEPQFPGRAVVAAASGPGAGQEDAIPEALSARSKNPVTASCTHEGGACAQLAPSSQPTITSTTTSTTSTTTSTTNTNTRTITTDTPHPKPCGACIASDLRAGGVGWRGKTTRLMSPSQENSSTTLKQQLQLWGGLPCCWGWCQRQWEDYGWLCVAGGVGLSPSSVLSADEHCISVVTFTPRCTVDLPG